MSSVVLIVFGMFIATFIPRYLPFVISRNYTLPGRLRAFLSYVPVAALGALIFPDLLSAVPGRPLAALAGAAFAVVYSLCFKNIFISVAGSIASTYLVILLIG